MGQIGRGKTQPSGKGAAPTRGSPRRGGMHVSGSVRPGLRFGDLEVLEEGEPYVWRGRFSRRRWICACECGSQTEVREDRLKGGTTRSCGCIRDSISRERLLRHGGRAEGRATPEYWAWQALLHRDGDARVCRRWRAGSGRGFAAFHADVGDRPGAGWRLTRIDPSRAWGPGNVHWAPDVPRRGVPRRLVTWRGRRMTLSEAAETAGVPYARLCKRLERGWPPAEALRP